MNEQLLEVEEDFRPTHIYWNERDFVVDTYRLKPTERRLLRTLVQQAYFCDTRPYLPADDNLLWQLADADSLEQWQEHKRAVLQFFHSLPNEPLLYNKRVLIEWKKIALYLEQKSIAGKASAARRRERKPLAAATKR